MLLGSFALTLLASALLLFAVQPMVGKILLPWLGGTPAVWNTCMMFFQALLLAGYGYAHFLGKSFTLAKQWRIHAIVLVLALIPLAGLRFDVAPLAKIFLPPEATSPVPWLLVVLFFTAGFPFFAVAATAPLLQRWFSKTTHPDAKDPYFLYGASNLGSMVALIAYPFWVEPKLGVFEQGIAWLVGFVVLSGLILWTGKFAMASLKAEDDPVTMATPSEKIALSKVLCWTVLGMIPSSVMLGVTTYITTDIAAIPLLWILPLTLYLLSFILVFSRIPLWLSGTIILGITTYFLFLYKGPSSAFTVTDDGFPTWLGDFLRTGGTLRLVEFLFVGISLLGAGIASKSFVSQHNLMIFLLPFGILGTIFAPALRESLGLSELEIISVHLLLLFLVSMVCHGELARTRPSVEHLTLFYLAMSFGGVLGGIFNTVIAPVLFHRVVEYPLMAVMACLMLPVIQVAGQGALSRRLQQACTWLIFVFGLASGAILLAINFLPLETGRDWITKWIPTAFLREHILDRLPEKLDILHEERNFFGTFQIIAEREKDGTLYHKLLHGTTNHGMQAYEPIARRRDTVTYFHNKGALGQLFETMRDRASTLKRPLNVAVLGVGTGTLAAYMETNWSLDLFEIDPAVVEIATKREDLFTFIPDAIRRGVIINIQLGDGRRKLNQSKDGKYDLIFMDAFTSDAVPVHLLTKEAFEIYKSKLTPEGIVVINIANRYLNFEPVLGNMAEAVGMKAMIQGGFEHAEEVKYGTNWVVMAPSLAAFGALTKKESTFERNGETWTEKWSPLNPDRDFGVWTDDYSNLPGILK